MWPESELCREGLLQGQTQQPTPLSNRRESRKALPFNTQLRSHY